MEQEIKNRIREVLAFYRYSVLAFCNKLGKPTATYNRQLKEEDATLTSSFIFDILTEFPDVSADWLLRGIGDMLLSNNSGCNVANGIGNSVTNSQINSTSNDLIKVINNLQDQNRSLIEIINNLTNLTHK